MNKYLRMLFLIVCVLLSGKSVFASATPIPERYVVKDNVILYVYGEADENIQAEYQIGNIACNVISSGSIEETDARVHTVILWDNSVSVMGKNDATVRSLLQDIIANRGENEVFTLATLSQGIDFQNSETNDYVELKTTIEQMEVENKDAFVIENLYSVVNAINKIEDYDFYRIIVLSDGVDSNAQGASLEELINQLKETPYPVYTISTGGASVETTKNLFSISRATNAGYFSIVGEEATSINDILSVLRKGAKVTRVEATIPEELRDGSEKNTQLTIGEQSYESVIKMPFSIKEEKEPEVIEEPTPITETQIVEVEKTSPITYALIGIVLTGIIVAIVLMILNKKKKTNEIIKQEEKDKFDEIYGKDDVDGEYTLLTGECETEIIGSYESDNGYTVIEDSNAPKLILKNVTDSSEAYFATLTGTVTVGRGVKNKIRITDNKAVSDKHCEFFVVDGELYVRDAGSSNGTKILGERISSPTLISSGDTVTIGFCDYTVTVK